MKDHHDKNSLLLLLYNELPEEEKTAIQDHVSACETCRHELMMLKETLTLYKQIPLETPPEEILFNAVTQKEKTRDALPASSSPSPSPWFIAAACLLAIVTGAFLLFSSDGATDLAWRKSDIESLDLMYQRAVLWQDNTLPLLPGYPDTEWEILDLKKQIQDFSETLSTQKF